MSLQRLLSRWKRWMCGRTTAQQMAEFSLAIAVISITGIAGLTVLGRAEERYFIPLQEELGRPVEGGGSEVGHNTKLTLKCSVPPLPPVAPPATSTIAVGDEFTCTDIFVEDTQRNGASPPTDGHVELVVTKQPNGPTDSTSCTPTIVLNYYTSACLDRSLKYTFTPGSYDVYAKFVSVGTHRSFATLHFTVIVQPKYKVVIDSNQGCWTPWNARPYEKLYGAWHTELGHPIRCTVRVTNYASPNEPQGDVIVKWSHNAPGTGRAFFNCYSNNDVRVIAGCDAPTDTYSCTTDSAGQCKIIFRWDMLQSADADAIANQRVTLTATTRTTDLTAVTGENQTTTDVIVTPVGSAHKAGMSMQCEPTSGPGIITFETSPWPVVNHGYLSVDGVSVIHVKAPRAGDPITGSFTCHMLVYDADPSVSFERIQPCLYPVDTNFEGRPCNLDDAEAHPPFGAVQWRTSPDPLGMVISCNLTSWGRHLNGYQPAGGQPESVSSCDIHMDFNDHPPASVSLYASYTGEVVASPPHRKIISTSQYPFTISFEPGT